MAVDFFFEKPTFGIPELKPIAAFKWQHVPNEAIPPFLAAEEQYLAFHLYMLEHLRFTEAGRLNGGQLPYVRPLGLSVRAGAIKAAVLLAASIIEAALRAHAEKRGYKLNPDPKRRTLGNVIRAWEHKGKPHPDVEAIWPNVCGLHDARNSVHLYKAAGDDDASWQAILNNENQLLTGALCAIEHVAKIKS